MADGPCKDKKVEYRVQIAVFVKSIEQSAGKITGTFRDDKGEGAAADAMVQWLYRHKDTKTHGKEDKRLHIAVGF